MIFLHVYPTSMNLTIEEASLRSSSSSKSETEQSLLAHTVGAGLGKESWLRKTSRSDRKEKRLRSATQKKKKVIEFEVHKGEISAYTLFDWFRCFPILDVAWSTLQSTSKWKPAELFSQVQKNLDYKHQPENKPHRGLLQKPQVWVFSHSVFDHFRIKKNSVVSVRLYRTQGAHEWPVWL